MPVADEVCTSPDNQVHLRGTIDLLDRGKFIDQLIRVAETLSKNKKNACYALNGEWGVGKTFVLNIFEEQLRAHGQEGSTLSRYLVFHYNCWQYDYYEEPLVAIIATILDQIDEQVCSLPFETVETIKAILKAIGISIAGKAHAIFKERTGVDLSEIGKILKNTIEFSTRQIEETGRFDSYFDLKQTLQKLSDTMGNLAKEQTVVLVVDELDRCLPEYAVKVLERLHHIFDSIPNFQVVLAVDKQQLENTVTQIYGENVSVERYLDKFLDFEVKLVVGEVTDDIKAVYAQYFNSFTYEATPSSDVNAVCTTLLKGIEIRVCKALIEKSYLCHRLLNEEATKADASVLCIELFLTLLKEYGLNVPKAKSSFSVNRLFTSDGIFSSTTRTLTGLAVLSEKYKLGTGGNGYYTEATDRKRGYIDTRDIWGLLLGCYRTVLGFTQDVWTNGPYSMIFTGHKSLQEYALNYWQFIQTIN